MVLNGDVSNHLSLFGFDVNAQYTVVRRRRDIDFQSETENIGKTISVEVNNLFFKYHKGFTTS